MKSHSNGVWCQLKGWVRRPQVWCRGRDLFTLKEWVVGFWQEVITMTHTELRVEQGLAELRANYFFFPVPKAQRRQKEGWVWLQKGFFIAPLKSQETGACNIEEESVGEINCQMFYQQDPGAVILVLLGLPCVKFQKEVWKYPSPLCSLCRKIGNSHLPLELDFRAFCCRHFPSFFIQKCLNSKSHPQLLLEYFQGANIFDHSSSHTYTVLFLHIRWYISLLLIPMLCCLSCSSVV